VLQILVNRRAAGFLLASWCCLLFIFSSIPGNEYPEVRFPGADKIVHIILYLIVGLLASIYYLPHGYRKWVPLAFGILFGVSDEVHQFFVSLRTFSLADLAADTAGVGIGIFTFHFCRERVPVLKLFVNNNNASETL